MNLHPRVSSLTIACFIAFGSGLTVVAQAQQAAPASSEVKGEATSDATKEPTALERMQAAAEADVNTRYGLLNTISPRGASDEDRAEIVKLLTKELDSNYADVRARAARVLSLFGDDAAPAIPAMLKLIGDEEPTVTLEAVWVPVSKALAEIGPKHALEPLMDALDETFKVEIEKDKETGRYSVDWGDRTKYYGITAAIAGMGEGAAETTPVFINLLRNGPENRRWATMFALSELGDSAEPAIPDLIANLDHRDFNFQVIACRALAKHGAKSIAAAPKLVK